MSGQTRVQLDEERRGVAPANLNTLDCNYSVYYNANGVAKRVGGRKFDTRVSVKGQARKK